MGYMYHKSEGCFTFLLTNGPRNPNMKLSSLLQGVAPMSIRAPKIERLECQLNLNYNWGYEKTRQDLRDLYKKAQRSQWNPDDTLPWETDVDLEKLNYPEHLFPLYGTHHYEKMTPRERNQAQVELSSWVTS